MFTRYRPIYDVSHERPKLQYRHVQGRNRLAIDDVTKSFRDLQLWRNCNRHHGVGCAASSQRIHLGRRRGVAGRPRRGPREKPDPASVVHH